MLINLIPDFLAVAQAADPVEAYRNYFATHRRILSAYWHNYVVEPEEPHFTDIVSAAVAADRRDLHKLLESTDIVGISQAAFRRCHELLDIDADIDVVLMVGVGGANAGELVVDGKAIVFVCVEHFTGVANHQTHGLGLDPELIVPWLAHEIAHAVRYTSPRSESEMRSLIAANGGWYSYWETGRDATLGEMLINEGIAVQASRLASPGHAPWEYFGYGRKEYSRVREMESIVSRLAQSRLGDRGLGLRLQFLSGGMSADARTIERVTIPERCGYLLGARMVEDAIAENGLAWTVRANANEILRVASLAAQPA